MEIANSFIAVLDELGKKFGLMVDWSQQNVQPYVQELMGRIIKYEIFKSALGLIMGIGILASVVICIVFLMRRYQKDLKEWKDNGIGRWGKPYAEDYILSVFLILPISLGVLMIVFNVIQIAKCLTAPEFVFLNILQSLA